MAEKPLQQAADQAAVAAAGAVGEIQQGPAVVEQLQAIPQNAQGGVLQPGGSIGPWRLISGEEKDLLGMVVLQRRGVATPP